MIKEEQQTESVYQLNLIPFDFEQKEIKIGLSLSEIKGWYKIHHKALPADALKLLGTSIATDAVVYLSFKPRPNRHVQYLIELHKHRTVARLYAYELFGEHFKQNACYLKWNFVRNLVVLTPSTRHTDYVQLNRIELKVEFPKDVIMPRLRMTYTGDSAILLQPLSWLDEVHPEAASSVKWVMFDKQIRLFDELTIDEKGQHENIYPSLNKSLKAALGIQEPREMIRDKHRRQLQHVKDFLAKLQQMGMPAGLVLKGGWVGIPEYTRLARQATALRFGNGHVGTDIYRDLKAAGPYKPLPFKQLVCFFIHLAGDEDAKLRVRQLLVPKNPSGFGGGQGLSTYLRIAVAAQPAMDVVVEPGADVVETVRAAVSNFSLDPTLAYMAIYLSPYDKWENRQDKHRIYFQIKEILLQRHIASQVVSSQKIKDPKNNISYWLPNIAMAAIAKLGGIPWVLDKVHLPSLVVGFGMYRSRKFDMKYIGSTFCFTDDGLFKGFDYFPDSAAFAIGAKLEQALQHYVQLHGKPDRLVIHYSKNIGKEAFSPILQKMYAFDPGIPVILVKLNSTRTEEYFVRDTRHASGYPVNGTVFRLYDHNYLVYVSKFDGTGDPKLQPMPLRCSLGCKQENILDDEALVLSLLQQAYDFAHLYWRSVNQTSVPVTVHYPSMLAEMTAWFENESILGSVGDLPWFL